MDRKTLKRSVSIHAPIQRVWATITDPEQISQFLFGTRVETDWQEGSPIHYSGTWEGREYHDKGTVLEVDTPRRLKHTYWSSLSGNPDETEYYQTVTYELQEQGEETILTVTQLGLMTEEGAEHSGKNWEVVLQKLRELVEKQQA
ncbi:MAG TPA: SRPBCC domain-containing protein [Chitinophagaceae bacterium]|nr:SRPBCC domain-containing protein [Chitinophagaceae bacterium]